MVSKSNKQRGFASRDVAGCRVEVLRPEQAAIEYENHEGSKVINGFGRSVFGILIFGDESEAWKYSFENETPSLCEFKSVRIVNVIPNVTNAEFAKLCGEVSK